MIIVNNTSSADLSRRSLLILYKSTTKVPSDAWYHLGRNHLVLEFESVLSSSSEEGEFGKKDAVVLPVFCLCCDQ